MMSRAVFVNFARYYSSLRIFPNEMRGRLRWRDSKGNLEGVKYESVVYFPRRPNYVDPPITPSKLLLVTRVKSFRGIPWWEKKTLISLGFKNEKHVNDPVIFKNTAAICVMLWKVKHLVKIVPIKLPDKLPTTDDLNATYLHENGTLYVVSKVDPIREEATEKFVNDPKKLNRDIIQEKLRLKWLEGNTM